MVFASEPKIQVQLACSTKRPLKLKRRLSHFIFSYDISLSNHDDFGEVLKWSNIPYLDFRGYIL